MRAPRRLRGAPRAADAAVRAGPRRRGRSRPSAGRRRRCRRRATRPRTRRRRTSRRPASTSPTSSRPTGGRSSRSRTARCTRSTPARTARGCSARSRSSRATAPRCCCAATGSTCSATARRAPASPRSTSPTRRSPSCAARRTSTATIVDARLTGRTARVVVSSYPEALYGPAELRALPSGWLPVRSVRYARTGRTVTRRAVGCRAVRRPAVFSGAGVLTVYTVDLDKGLPAVDADAVFTDADTVYASPSSLYVATQRYDVAGASHVDPPLRHLRPRPHGLRGERRRPRHPAQPVLAVGGQGRAARRHHGRLRPRRREQGHDAVAAGRPARAARPGRRARARRAHLRRPLHRRRRLRGHVPPDRSALHRRPRRSGPPARPRRAEDPRLLGLPAPGRRRPAARRSARRRPTTAASRASSSRSSTSRTSPGRCGCSRRSSAARFSSSAAEWDHHAFLWWPATKLALLPIDSEAFTGAAGFRVERGARDRRGRADHPSGARRSWTPSVDRAVVVGDKVFTISGLGVKASALAGFASAAGPRSRSRPTIPAAGRSRCPTCRPARPSRRSRPARCRSTERLRCACAASRGCRA